MRAKVLAAAIIVFWTAPCVGQDDPWSRSYGNGGADEGNCVQQTMEGGYIVCGSSRSFGIPPDAYLIKTDSLGHIEWSRCCGGNDADNTRSLQQTADGGYLASGQTDALGAGGADDAYLLKIDSLGNITWTRTYGGTGSEAARFVEKTDDGGCVLAGGTSSFGAGGEDFFLLKADSLGDTLWARTYGGDSGDAGHCVRQTSDGGYIVVGDTKSFGAGECDMYVIKTNSVGDTLWTRTYGGSGQDAAKSVQQTSDGGYILAGTSDSFGSGDSNVCVIKVDSLGDVLWARTYGGSSEDVGYWIEQTWDGGYIVAGWTYSFGSGDRDAYLIKTDSAGEITWSRKLGGYSQDHIYSVQQTTDGGYIVTGATGSFDGSSNVWLTKLDSEGNSCVGEFVSSTVAVAAPTVTSPPTEVNPYAVVIGNPTSTVTLPPTQEHTICPLPTVISTSPTQNELNIPVSTDISVTFDMDMDEASINDSTFIVNARSTGLHEGTISYDGPTRTASFDPTEDFDVGEVVTVVLTTAVESSEGVALSSGYAWSFTLEVSDASPGTFQLDSTYVIGDTSTCVFAADLDGDGDVDLATANSRSDNVSILLNSGDGTFVFNSAYGVGDSPQSIYAADLDSDGDIDLATGNYLSNNVSVLMNNGEGLFVLDSNYPVADTPQSLLAADLDGDGDIDLATVGFNSFMISVLPNSGDGTFTDSVNYPVAGRHNSIFAADFDGDGCLDLATGDTWDPSDEVSILLNNCDGTFADEANYPAIRPISVHAADVNADGCPDLVTAGENQVSVLSNNCNGTFADFGSYPVGEGASCVFAADVDGDNDLDLITGNASSGNISILPNDGDGTFGDSVNYSVDASPASVFAADFDGDLDVDIATANSDNEYISILFNIHDSVPETLWIFTVGPVDMIVTDPELDSISVGFNTIPSAAYLALENTDTVTVPNPYVGEYLVRVISDNAAPGDSYSLGIRIDGSMETPPLYAPAPPGNESDTYGYTSLPHLPGDANGDDNIDLGDVIFIINYLFKGGPLPDPLELADVNCDEIVDIGDAVYLLNYLFKNGDPPCSGPIYQL